MFNEERDLSKECNRSCDILLKHDGCACAMCIVHNGCMYVHVRWFSISHLSNFRQIVRISCMQAVRQAGRQAVYHKCFKEILTTPPKNT